MTDAIRAWRNGTEAALTPVVEYYRRQFDRDAQRENSSSGAHSFVDPTDVVSRGMEYLATALDDFDPDAGTPFPGFFEHFRRAALRSEKAASMGPFSLSRRTLTERGKVFSAVEAVRAKTRTKTPAAPRAIHPTPFQITPLEFSDADVLSITVGTERDARRTAFARLVGVLAAYLRDALATSHPRTMEAAVAARTADGRARPDDALIRRLLRMLLASENPLAWPATRRGVEAMLASRMRVFVERLARTDHPATMRRAANESEFVVAVAKTAGTTPTQAQVLLRLNVHGVSIDQPATGKHGRGLTTVGDHIATPDVDTTGDLIRAKAAMAIRFMPLGSEFIFLKMMGLNGKPPMSQDEIGLAFGLTAREVRHYVKQIFATLEHPDVFEFLHGAAAAQAQRRARAAEDLAMVLRAWPAAVQPRNPQPKRRSRSRDAAAAQRDFFDLAGNDSPR